MSRINGGDLSPAVCTAHGERLFDRTNEAITIKHGMVSCPFCEIESTRTWIDNKQAIAFLNAYPTTEGHTLVIPRRHVASIYELCAEPQSAVWKLVADVRERLLEQLRPDGFNIGVNDGLAAGQTVMHAHVHIIPRHKGDVPDPRGGIRWMIADHAKYWD